MLIASLEREGEGCHGKRQCGRVIYSRATPSHCGYQLITDYPPGIGMSTWSNKAILSVVHRWRLKRMFFFQCEPAHQLWGCIRYWLQMWHEMTLYKRMLCVFGLQYCDTGRLVKVRHLAMLSLIHFVWQAMNQSKFEGVYFDIEVVFKKIQVHIYRSLDIYSDMILHHI